MLWPTYETNIANLENYHKKDLNQEQHDLYFRMLQNIDDNSFSDIIDKWIKGARPMPGQFPTINDLLALYYSWQSEHPEVFKKGIKIACKECFGKGWLWFRHPDPRDPDPPDPNAVVMYEAIVGCEKCKGFKIDVGPVRRVPTSTREKLKAAGYNVWPYPEMVAAGEKIRKANKSLGELVGAVGQDPDEIPF
jgi:hypothetical protein